MVSQIGCQLLPVLAVPARVDVLDGVRRHTVLIEHERGLTWRIGASAPERVTVRFEPRDDGTEVVVVHEHITTAPLRDRHEAGWHGCIDGLVGLVEHGDLVD